MKIFSIIIFNCLNEKIPFIITSNIDVSNFGYFKRGTVTELLFFVSREIIERTPFGERHIFKHDLQEEMDGVKNFLCHSYISPQKMGGVVITDGDYQSRVAFILLSKAFEEVLKQPQFQLSSIKSDVNWKITSIKELMDKYQKPEEVDQILKINKDLEETKQIIIESIDKLLIRGEKLENLMEKSQDLSFQSKAFLKKSKELNRCCTII